jgi:hypothetical protein
MGETADRSAEQQPAASDPVGELAHCERDLRGLLVAIDDRPRDLDANHGFAHERVERVRWLVKYQLAIRKGPLDETKYGKMLGVFYSARRLENSRYEVYERVYQSYEPRAELPDLPPTEEV